jgi:hypothetical protein
MWQCRRCNFSANFRMTPKKCPRCEVDNAKSPLWVRLLQRLSKPEDIGLGATIKRIAAKVGGERFKAWSTKIGLPCGCTEREAEWNRLYPNPNYRQP